MFDWKVIKEVGFDLIVMVIIINILSYLSVELMMLDYNEIMLE